MVKIMIVEDEILIAKGLESIVESIRKDVDATITAYAAKALDSAKSIKYDLFLLDIQLKDYSGYELAKQIRNIDKYKLTPIIFITAIPTGELKAFKEIHCYDYIIKPFEKEKVKELIGTILNHGVKDKKEELTLKIKQRQYIYVLKQSEIIYIESNNKNLSIVTIKEKTKLSNYSLKTILTELGPNFVRCHRSFIINIEYISKILKDTNSIVLRNIDESIPIGRKYKYDLKDV